MSKIKSRKNIPVLIVENHHEVVPLIHRDIGSKHLPFSDLTLIHFDSHPDMLIPVDMQADTVFVKEALYDALSIENWILPLAHAGHIKDIYWLKPPWCTQIQDKHFTFYVGKCCNTGTIRTTCTESYFVSETLYVPESELVEKKLVSLTVITVVPEKWSDIAMGTEASKVSRNKETASGILDKSQSKDVKTDTKDESTDSPTSPKQRKTDEPLNVYTDENLCSELNKSLYSCLKELSESLGSKQFILDIDLDFYSTKNPFQGMYTAQQMTLLKKLYKYTGPEEKTSQAIQRCVSLRQKQLSDLKLAIMTLSKDISAEVEMEVARLEMVRELVTSFQSCEPDFDILHDAGCTMDDTELPHHVSSGEEICALVQETKQILEALPRPALITVSRSSDDDYCPPDQVDYIEEAVSLALEEVYVYTQIQKHYLGSEEEPAVGTSS
ncbi:LOW QUALITY PROTEIN: UPF0489 protein C5orf22 homolog [Haliotis rubra]|uniref:LOW QUALITY PROTEIN: UPF0489 protein C5orf22 homolog n=1 Tax=Haliotis rubra TaxID=36100 RepID=UPI001EE55A23|nr:LOW QUALITY PROTEIN: UPF0489 protein C5orf22 homolog [Haliotis rubra]